MLIISDRIVEVLGLSGHNVESIGRSSVGILYNVSSLHKSYINPIYTLPIIICTLNSSNTTPGAHHSIHTQPDEKHITKQFTTHHIPTPT
jgi:hypothetical protein